MRRINDMVNAWSLLYEELNGTMDETYPIKENSVKKDEITILGGDGEDTLTAISADFPSSNYAADTVPFDNSWWAEDGFSVVGNPFTADPCPDTISFSGVAGTQYDHPKYYGGSDTLNLGPTRLPGGMGEDHISFGSTASYEYGFPSKPQPNFKYKSQKYQEDKGIQDLKDYVSSTYQGHYTNDSSDVQTLDLIQSVGDAEAFCRSNAIKYLSRYDKKGQAKRDILKAMHYCLLLYYFSGNTNDETATHGYETF